MEYICLLRTSSNIHGFSRVPLLKKVLIIAGGFVGLNTAKNIGNVKGVKVTLVDRNNFHLFHHLLFQVSMNSDISNAAGVLPCFSGRPSSSVLLLDFKTGYLSCSAGLILLFISKRRMLGDQ
jgi:hypothetical protein